LFNSLLGDFNLLLGRPFTGESCLVASLATSISQGAPFLGRQCTKMKVAYFALERNGQKVAELFDK
jgi:RecA-family ATPase